MKEIKVHKKELLDQLRNNLSEHRRKFEAALSRYREEVIKELDVMLADARAGRCIKRSVSLVEPHDYSNDYRRAIRICEMHVDDVISLTESEFQQYVMDEWGWQATFSTTNAQYGVE